MQRRSGSGNAPYQARCVHLAVWVDFLCPLRALPRSVAFALCPLRSLARFVAQLTSVGTLLGVSLLTLAHPAQLTSVGTLLGVSLLVLAHPAQHNKSDDHDRDRDGDHYDPSTDRD
jgi:hypothetical protein